MGSPGGSRSLLNLLRDRAPLHMSPGRPHLCTAGVDCVQPYLPDILRHLTLTQVPCLLPRSPTPCCFCPDNSVLQVGRPCCCPVPLLGPHIRGSGSPSPHSRFLPGSQLGSPPQIQPQQRSKRSSLSGSWEGLDSALLSDQTSPPSLTAGRGGHQWVTDSTLAATALATGTGP